MRDLTVPRMFRIFWVMMLIAGLWVGAVQMFALHHHEHFQTDNDCAMCQLIAAGIRLNNPARVPERTVIFFSGNNVQLHPFVPLSTRFLKLRAPSTSPPVLSSSFA